MSEEIKNGDKVLYDNKISCEVVGICQYWKAPTRYQLQIVSEETDEFPKTMWVDRGEITKVGSL
jgi:hypothetical protein